MPKIILKKGNEMTYSKTCYQKPRFFIQKFLQRAHHALSGNFAPAYLGGSNNFRPYLFFIYVHIRHQSFLQLLDCTRNKKNVCSEKWTYLPPIVKGTHNLEKDLLILGIGKKQNLEREIDREIEKDIDR